MSWSSENTVQVYLGANVRIQNHLMEYTAQIPTLSTCLVGRISIRYCIVTHMHDPDDTVEPLKAYCTYIGIRICMHGRRSADHRRSQNGKLHASGDDDDASCKASLLMRPGANCETWLHDMYPGAACQKTIKRRPGGQVGSGSSAATVARRL